MDKRLYTSGEYVSHFRPDSEKNAFRELYAAKRDYLINRIPGKDLRILDLGGGMGRLTIPLARRHRVVLADLSMEMLRLAGENGTGFERVQCDAEEELCFENESFDCVLVIDLLSHVSKAQKMLAEIRRVLKPDGMLFIDATNSNPLWVLNYPRYVNPLRRPVRWLRTVMGGGIPPEWQGRIHHLSRTRFEHLLDKAGFSVFEWASFGPIWCPKWFLAVCTKR
jgi:ubiquinone/menaquinone biosynthesis C-methylase UbiE